MKRFFIITILTVVSAICMLSCGKDVVYSERKSFDNYSWDRLSEQKTVSFENINITDTSKVYNIYVTVRHTPYINENTIKFLMSVTSEDGIRRISTHSIDLKDPVEDKWLGKAAGDLIDVEQRTKAFVSFPEKGKYKIELTNLGAYVKLIGIMDIGIRVEQADLKEFNNAD